MGAFHAAALPQAAKPPVENALTKAKATKAKALTTAKTTKAAQKHLLPERYPQEDLFICDVADAVLKDLVAELEHPFYSLSKRPEMQVRRYEHNGNWLEVVPSVKGLATIYDKDILIYCISQLIAKKNRGEPLSKKVRLTARDLLMFSNRGTSGKDYEALCESLDRLDGTRIRTNIRNAGEEQFRAFGLIDSASVARKYGLDGRLLWCEVVLSDWVFEAVNKQDVLTLHRDYFRLRKPLERRVYELARKHCGQQDQWVVSLELLHKKSGSRSPVRHFRYLVKNIARQNYLPDYQVSYCDINDQVTFYNRHTMTKSQPGEITLQPETREKAREIAPGWDIAMLEQEWRDWMVEEPRQPDAAFLGFCKKWAEKRRLL